MKSILTVVTAFGAVVVLMTISHFSSDQISKVGDCAAEEIVKTAIAAYPPVMGLNHIHKDECNKPIFFYVHATKEWH